MTTTIFRVNSFSDDIAYDAGAGFKRATFGGVLRGSDGEIVENFSNETTTPWYSGGSVAVVGSARDIATSEDERWRAMLRFVLRDQTVTSSSIVSGSAPASTDWPYVTGARLVFYNGDSGGLQPEPDPVVISTSALRIRVGRGLYTPSGAQERPFGTNSSQAGVCYLAAASLGSLETTLAWDDWAVPDRTNVTVTLSQTTIDAYLKTITGASDDYLDFAFILDQEGVDGVNILRELGAWEPNYPTLEIDFDVPTSVQEVHVRRASGEVEATRSTEAVRARRASGEVESERSSGRVVVRKHGGEVEEVWR